MKKLLYTLFTLTIALGAFSVHAQPSGDNYTLLEPLPCLDGVDEGVKCVTKDGISVKPEIDFNTYLSYIFKFGIAIAGFLAVVMIIVGGFEYMLSEAPFAKTNGKDRMTNAIIGLLGVLTSYLILVTIDPRLVQINSALPPVVVFTDEVETFRRNLEGSLNGLSADSALKITEIEFEKVANQKIIDALKDKHQNVGELNEKEEAELKILEDKNRELEADKIKVVAHEEMFKNFRQAFERINRAENNVAPETYRYAIRGELAEINAMYNKLKPQLEANNDFEGAQDLEFRKTFMEENLTEQISIITKMKDTWVSNPKPVEELLAKTKAELDDLSTPYEVNGNRIKKSPELEVFYRALLESRISLLTKKVAELKK